MDWLSFFIGFILSPLLLCFLFFTAYFLGYFIGHFKAEYRKASVSYKILYEKEQNKNLILMTEFTRQFTKQKKIAPIVPK